MSVLKNYLHKRLKNEAQIDSSARSEHDDNEIVFFFQIVIIRPNLCDEQHAQAWILIACLNPS